MGDIYDKVKDDHTREKLRKELIPFEDKTREEQLKELGQKEFDDWVDVLIMGAAKHGTHNWLNPSGSKSSRKDMYASAWRHIAESYTGVKTDHESGLHPLKHAIARLQMIYTREVRGITHPED